MGLETFVYLIVILAVLGIAWWAISSFNLPPPVRIVAVVVIALVAIVLLLQIVGFGGAGGFHFARGGCP